jgi:hypothetical protein
MHGRDGRIGGMHVSSTQSRHCGGEGVPLRSAAVDSVRIARMLGVPGASVGGFE